MKVIPSAWMCQFKFILRPRRAIKATGAHKSPKYFILRLCDSHSLVSQADPGFVNGPLSYIFFTSHLRPILHIRWIFRQSLQTNKPTYWQTEIIEVTLPIEERCTRSSDGWWGEGAVAVYRDAVNSKFILNIIIYYKPKETTISSIIGQTCWTIISIIGRRPQAWGL